MVTIPADCMKVSFVFDLYDGGQAIEQGVFGFHGRRVHTVGNNTDWGVAVQKLSEKMREKFIADVPTSYFSGAIVMNRCDVYHLNTANKTLDKGSALFDTGHAWGGSAGTGMAWETALVVSLYGYTPGSFAQGARNKRGRFYLPPLRKDATDAVNGCLALQTQTDLTNMLEGWLNDVQGTELEDDGSPVGPADYFDLGILSTAKKTDPNYAGAFVPATNLRLGRVIDVQRRRRKKQDERYMNRAIAHA
jgi:hypothetical protein